MKRNLLLSTLLLASASMAAQGFDGSFDEPWETCYPDGKTAVGMQPKGWMASNVAKMGFIKSEMVKPISDRSGNENGYAVEMVNNFAGLATLGATAPGYLTLGKAWAYGDIEATMDPSREDTSDGGAYGGIAFTARPDSMVFWAKRAHAVEKPAAGSFNPEERATVVFYSWTGSSTSKVTTGLSTAPEVIDMVDREKDILGKIKEGVTGNFKLVAANEYYIEGDIAEWTRQSFAIDYKDKENKVNPEKMNIIFSASDYFDRSALGTGNTLSVDDVQFIYNSRLKSLTVGGKEVPGFDNGVFEYQLPADMADAKVEAEAFGKEANVEVVKNGNVSTVTVTDETANGEKVHTYTLTFKGEVAEIQLPAEVPALTYGDEVDGLGFTSNNTKDALVYSFSKEGVLEAGEDGKVRAVGAGEVVVTASQPGSDDFTPAESEPMTLTVAKAPLQVSLAEDSWTWRGINVSSYNMEDGKCHYAFVYDGWKWNDAGKDASEILSKLPTVSASAPKEAEAVGSERAAKLSGGEAANYELKLPETAKIKVVKNKVGVYLKYGNNTLSSAYDGERYRTVKVAVGQDEYSFTVGYADAVYDDEEVLAGMEVLPEAVCDVNKDAAIGAEFPVSVKLPEGTSFENFDFISIVPETAKLVMAANPGITVTVPEKVVYGDEFTLVSNEHGITYGSTVLTAGVVSMTSKGVVTAKKVGKAELVVTTAAKTVDDIEYGATATNVSFDVEKAPLTVTAKDVKITMDDELPAIYELVYEGWIGKDTVETVFEVAPVAQPELPAELVPGTYPIVVKVETMPENYEVKTVDGTLTVEKGSGVASVDKESTNVTYANGNLYVPCGGRVEVYALTGTLVGRYEGTVIPVALRTNTLYIVKTQKGAFRLLIK